MSSHNLGAFMGTPLPSFVKSLVKFLSKEIEENHIEYLVPLESKGALLVDLALDSLPTSIPRPLVLYLRSLEYLPESERNKAVFGIFDDFVFSGRTLSNAIKTLNELGIPNQHIHSLAFFKFPRMDQDDADLLSVLSLTKVPSDDFLQKLSQDHILRYVQSLAIQHKIPASYDNLHWEVSLSIDNYRQLMHQLTSTGWLLYYGRRGPFDASALLVRERPNRPYFSLPKIRFWYNVFDSKLHITPISYPSPQTGSNSQAVSKLTEILTPKNANIRQQNLASLQAQAFLEQITLLGFIKPFFKLDELYPKLNQTHLHRYFGPRSSIVIQFLEDQFEATPDQSISTPHFLIPQRLDFYWIAVEIMRLLGTLYWTQPNPNKISMGLTVAELVERFGERSSLETVHAAIDYCADMNLIATFFGWQGDLPFRAFRLTENGETEVGRNDGKQPRKLTSVEKLGALILSKSINQEAYWWLLEKIPPLLIHRFKFELPQFQASMNFYGDTTLLYPTDDPDYPSTWPQIETDIWETREEFDETSGKQNTIFRLVPTEFDVRKKEIFNDPDIIRVIGSVETLIELTKSKTMGHHVAILMDILSDEAGGATYLSNSLIRAARLIRYRSTLSKELDYQRVSKEISNWLDGIDEKIELLTNRREILLNHINSTVNRLIRQRRGDLAGQLAESPPFPAKNRIVTSFNALSTLVRRLAHATDIGHKELIQQITKEIVSKRLVGDDNHSEDLLSTTVDSVKRWATALSGSRQEAEYYFAARIPFVNDASYRLYIVAYDLIGSSGDNYASRDGANRDRNIQSIITNWFIAFGGFAQRPEQGGGDLGFGFFPSLGKAIQASLWAGHHLELLKSTNPSLRQDRPHAGFGIVIDDILPGFQGQFRSEWASRLAKAWKREAERIADNAGRYGRPIVAVQSDIFSGLENIPSNWLGQNDVLDGIQVQFIRPDAITTLPWK